MRSQPIIRNTLFVSLLLLAACGGEAAAGSAEGTTSTIGTAPGAEGTATTEPAPVGETATTVEATGEVAPDFTLALGEGGTFTLSEENKPVLLVFWAEW